MLIPFSLPLIDNAVISEVNDCLTRTGWLTSGPKVLELENEINNLTGTKYTICVNSWTSGAMLMLRWFGVGPGDEVIVPSYTYSATALCALNLGARVVMVDISDDFTIDVAKLEAAITVRTKVIIPVDVGGWPADYDHILDVINSEQVMKKFSPQNINQEKFGRILLLSDAAHSIGATYKGRNIGTCADVTVLSFHSVKNITTGEGGAVCLNLPAPFDNYDEYKFLKALALNGQTKSAFEKNQPGAWRYDIVAQGLKVNMPDICAAIGLAQIRNYIDTLLPERIAIFQRYIDNFSDDSRFILPMLSNDTGTKSSAHLFMLRVRGVSESDRDSIIQKISEKGIGVNVHYIPMPMLTLFRNLGYDISDFPATYGHYKGEISLPIYNGLNIEAVDYVCEIVRSTTSEVIDN